MDFAEINYSIWVPEDIDRPQSTVVWTDCQSFKIHVTYYAYLSES